MGKVKQIWSSNFSYAIGLIATDGCLYNDGRHINFTSKDEELVESFRTCLQLANKITRKSRGGFSQKRYFQIQFGDRLFHGYLGSIGLYPSKSKTIRSVKLPDEFFFDFFRGCIDGDGTIGTSRHPESKQLQLKLSLCSASGDFLDWMLKRIKSLAPEIAGGWVSRFPAKRVYKLAFGKSDSIKMFRRMYQPLPKHCLHRKYKLAKVWMGE